MCRRTSRRRRRRRRQWATSDDDDAAATAAATEEMRARARRRFEPRLFVGRLRARLYTIAIRSVLFIYALVSNHYQTFPRPASHQSWFGYLTGVVAEEVLSTVDHF